MSKYNQPRFTTSKMDCQCASTRRRINKGDTCFFDPKDKAVYHVESTVAQNHLERMKNETDKAHND